MLYREIFLKTEKPNPVLIFQLNNHTGLVNLFKTTSANEKIKANPISKMSDISSHVKFETASASPLVPLDDQSVLTGKDKKGNHLSILYTAKPISDSGPLHSKQNIQTQCIILTNTTADYKITSVVYSKLGRFVFVEDLKKNGSKKLVQDALKQKLIQHTDVTAILSQYKKNVETALKPAVQQHPSVRQNTPGMLTIIKNFFRKKPVAEPKAV